MDDLIPRPAEEVERVTGDEKKASSLPYATLAPGGGAPRPEIFSTSRDVALNVLSNPELKGLVIRQTSQVADADNTLTKVQWLRANGYKVSTLPAGMKVKHKPMGEGWEPTGDDIALLEPLFFVDEKSECGCTRTALSCLGCPNLRPLRMYFHVDEGGFIYKIDRPAALGGWCGCPLTMNLWRPTGRALTGKHEVQFAHVGRVRQNFAGYISSFFKETCLCTYSHYIERMVTDAETKASSFIPAYEVLADSGCFGPRNNCCGATLCCKNDMVFVIRDLEGNEVGYIQKTFGGMDDPCLASSRESGQYDNYMIEFPNAATSPDDRMLILTSLMQLDYQMFETQNTNSMGGVPVVGAMCMCAGVTQ